MPTRFRIGAFVLLLAASVLWAGCDSGGTGLNPAPPSVQFASGGAGAVPTDSTVSIGVTLTGSMDAPVSVEVIYANAASTTSFSDLGGFDSTAAPTKTIEFPASAEAGATQSFEVGVANADLSQGSKEAFFALQKLESSGTVEYGTPREFSLSIGAKPIAEARSEGRQALVDGQQVTVTISGTVSRAFGAFARIQDDSGPTGASGIVIRQTSGELSEQFQQDISDGVIQPGARLLVTGTISQFSGMLQINNEGLSSYSVISQGNPPSPQTVTLSEIKAPAGENFMSELLRVEGLTFPDASGTFESGTTYTVVDEEGTSFEFRIQGSDETNVIGEPIPEGTFTYEGVLGQFNVFSGPDVDEGYQFIPVQPGDIKESQ